jgi:hypothetical protein
MEWVDLVQQLLDAQWQRDPTPFALDVIRLLPGVQANTRTLDDRRAADPFMCAGEDLIARGVLRRDEHHVQLYQYMGEAAERTGNGGRRPPSTPTTDARQIQILTSLIHHSQVVRGPRVWLHWCGVEELCQALGWGPAEVADLEAAVIGPLEERALVRSYPAPGEMRFRPTYQGMRAAALPARA